MLLCKIKQITEDETNGKLYFSRYEIDEEHL